MDSKEMVQIQATAIGGQSKGHLRTSSRNFWIPQYRYQVENWLSKRYPEDSKKFKRMARSQLYAIYFSIRSKIEEVERWRSWTCLLSTKVMQISSS